MTHLKVILGSLAAFAIAAATMGIMSTSSTSLDPNNDQVGKISAACAAQPLSFLPPSSPAWLVNIFTKLPAGVTTYYCVLVGVFEALAVPRLTNAGLSWFFLPFASIHFMLMLKESVLVNSSFLAPLWAAFVGLMGQISGISVWFPLLWLPLHFYKSAAGSTGQPVTSFRFNVGALLTFFLLINITGIIALRTSTELTYFIIFFQIAPVLPGLIVAFLPRGAPNSAIIVQKIYMFFGGIGAMGHIIGLLTLINNPGSVEATLSLLKAGQGSGFAVVDLMIWVDFISFLASTLLLIFWDYGFIKTLLFIVLSPVLSPALIFAWFLSQEAPAVSEGSAKKPHSE